MVTGDIRRGGTCGHCVVTYLSTTDYLWSHGHIVSKNDKALVVTDGHTVNKKSHKCPIM